MTVELRFQTPGAEEHTLLRAIEEETGHFLSGRRTRRGPPRGGGIFAFASADGVKKLAENTSMERLLKRGKFTLVVGVDSITNTKALKEIAAQAATHPNLLGQVFVHNTGALFHPKLCWLADDHGITLIVGSGNLTGSGLGAATSSPHNWEAFTINHLSGRAARKVEGELTSWLSRQIDFLVPPESSDARDRAKANKKPQSSKNQGNTSYGPVVAPANADVFVGEIPRSGSRPSQVNIQKDHMKTFFGLGRHAKIQIVLHPVSANGAVGAQESRTIAVRKYNNYGFEAEAFKGHQPFTGNAIAVFVKLKSGRFLYQRIGPTDKDYPALEGFLQSQAGSRKGKKMRQIQTSAPLLNNNWPGGAIWGAPLPPP